jgi:hypothetical protein
LKHYVALDVSLKEVSVCILDEKGDAVLEGKTPADLSALADLIRSKAPDVVRLGLETGATAPWLYHALTAAGLPVICMDARHANAALSMRPRKSDRSDARGLADIPADGLVSRSQGKVITHVPSGVGAGWRSMFGALYFLSNRAARTVLARSWLNSLGSKSSPIHSIWFACSRLFGSARSANSCS